MAYDNLCKYLSEKYPNYFASWILGEKLSEVTVLKTELNLDPIRADSVTFLRTQERILHLEFQVKIPQETPMPLRMLNYWVRLYWQYRLPITQVLIWLKPTQNQAAFENQFVLESTHHQYQVIRMWEQSSTLFLQETALLPLATLTATENPANLLKQVADEIAKIEPKELRQEIASCSEILAGLRFKQNVIHQFLREDMMQESVIYQEIIQKGLEQGLEQGLERGKQAEISLIIRQLNRRIGQINSVFSEQIYQLSFAELEGLGEALLDFESEGDLVTWLTNK